MDEYEEIYAQFIIEKLENAGGCLKFQHITGHLSQLDDAVRRAVGTKPTALMKFLRKHDKIFVLEKNGLVSLQKSATVYNRNPDNSSESVSAFPKFLENHDGIVIKVLPNFGFIASKVLKTSVYCTPACFKNSPKSSFLTDLVECGQKVCFNARLGDAKFDSKYQATEVWLPSKVENEVLHPHGFQKLRKTRDTGKYDAPTCEGSGKVQKVLESFGFIEIDDDPKNTVYFAKKNVCNAENITNLTKLLKQGERVEFKAIRSTKKDSKTRWQASKVWIKGQGKPQEVQKGDREIRKNVPGKIYPNANGTVIKFGQKFEELADADSCLFYMHEIKVTDVCWEFSDGDNVMFDVIKIKSAPGWKALLSWFGQRPNIVLPVNLGDFSVFPDEEIDDIPETGSFTSKASSISASSELSQNSSKSLRNKSSLKVNNSHDTNLSLKHRNSRDSKKSDSLYSPTRSLSRSSRSSQYSNSNGKTFQKSKRQYRSSDRDSTRTFTNSNSYNKFHSRFENDSGFGSDQYVPREQNKSVKPFHGYNSNDSCEDIAEYVPPKPTIKGNNAKNRKELISKAYINWGDSPYPDEENSESDPDMESNVFSEACEETSHFHKNKSDDEKSSHKKFEEINFNGEFSDSEINYENVLNEMENENALNEMENENSGEDMINSNIRMDIEEKSEEYEEQNDVESMLEEESVDTSVSKETQIQPYIKVFCDLPGKIVKVYCKYAEIENERLKKCPSFFWTDFYYNGLPAPDHFDDLKEVIREGQTIMFNCIEIIDDSGSCWHKLTMAWEGKKPQIREMTPAEFILDNNLSVSAKPHLDGYEVINSSQNNTEQQKTAAPVRKFLTVAVEEEYEESLTLISEPPEAAAANMKRPSDLSRQELASKSDDIPQESSPSVDLVHLTEAVGKIFLSYRESKTDVDVVASEVISFVLSRAGIKSVPTVAVNSVCEKESQTERVTLVANIEKSNVNQNRDMTEMSAQTIITGDVIAQSIFTL